MALRIFLCFLLVVSAVQADPLLTSWSTANSAKYARVYTTTANRTSGNGATTWNTSGSTLPHTLPAYADIYEVSYSANWVYAKYTGLASYVTGPWLNPQGAVGNFWPGTQSVIRRFPRSPVQQTGTKGFTAAGASGIFVNGVAAFNSLDGWAWDGTQIQGGAQHTNGTYWWHRVAPVAESYNFDYGLGHQLPAGLYHNHQNPIALRYQLGDHVDYNSSTKNYSESAATVSNHSPILGWAHDGYPIYGPYGYSTATSATSGIRRMVSGYVKRDGKTTGTDTVTSATTTIPAWYARYRSNHSFNTYTTTSTTARSTDTSTYPIGIFAQDWAFLGDLIKTGSTAYAQATDYDLDEYNGRYCVTPEYPSGTYAYFTPLDSSGADTYPYVFNFEFYGSATGGTVTSITESVTNSFTGGAGTALAIPNTPSVTSGTVSLTWNSVEGGTYSVDASTDQSAWTSETASIAGASNATGTSSTYTALSSGTEYARVQRTAVASYDAPSVASTVTTAQSAIKSYSAAVNVAPTLTTISTLTGAAKNTAFTFSYATLLAASNAADANSDPISFQINAVSSGTLTKGGVAVTAGSTLISTSDSVVWTPASNVTGTVAAFTVKAYDGSLTSSSAVTVNITVTNADTAPTLTTISTLAGATEDTAFTLSYATLLAASNAADADGDTLSFQISAVSSGTLTKGGVTVTAGSTLISTGDSVVWTPAANANGTLAAFTVKAYDGTLTSSTAVQVNITTAAVNDAPTLTTVNTLTGAVKNTAYTISYTSLFAASNAADVDGDAILFRIEAVSTGTLTKSGTAVTAGSTTLGTGESLVWTPASNATGTLAAFTVRAYDGTLASSTAVQVSVTVAASLGDAQLTSWYTAQTGKYARITETDTSLANGTTETTWTRTSGPNTISQSSPVYAGPQQVDYSSSWVYLRTPSLGTYLMGPWYDDATRSDTVLFKNVPKNQGWLLRFPRTSTLGAIPTTKTQTAGYNVAGVMQPSIGCYVDGVAIFDTTDGFSYANGTESSPGSGSWHRDAYANEQPTFDKSFAHQQNTGTYHNHANPIALRYQLGDAVSYNSTTKAYSETMAPTGHSPIIGWMMDGLPVYGPYGYSSALDSTSGVRRMVGGFVKRDGTTTGVDNISTTGSTRTVPTWATRNGVTSTNGPAVSTTYPFARYVEDWAYLGDLIKTGSTKYALGTDFDLNEYNVRYCVTPEFPSGTYAYFLNLSSAGVPQMPYVVNRWFYGTPTGSSVTSVTETVTNQFTGGANRPLSITSAAATGTNVTLTWNAVEGGTYSVDASSNNSTWTSKATGLTVSAANTKSETHTALGTSGTEYARVNRTALATYDTTGTVTATVAQTNSTSFTLGPVNVAPTLTSISTISGAAEDTAFTLSYAALLAASNAADANGDTLSFQVAAVSSGTLTKNGTAVTPGSTLISTGDGVVWTPAANANGPLAAFTVYAFDGSLTSSSPVQVNITTAAVNDAPTLTSISTLTGALEDTAFTISYATLFAASNAADVDGDALSFQIAAVSSGTLTKGGVAVTPGNTLISTGDSVVWTSALHANGTLAAFTVKAWDSALASATAVQVSITTTATANVAQWSGGAGTSAWGTGPNWLATYVPDSIDSVSFAGASPFSIDLGANRTANGVAFSGNTAYTLANNTLTANSFTTSSPASGSITHTVSSAVSLGTTSTASVAASANLLLSGAVSGSGTLTKSGTGALIIGGAASATGGTTVSAGTLQIGNGGTTGSLAGGITMVKVGTLDFNRSDSLTYAGVIGGLGILTKDGAGKLTFSAGGHSFGLITVNAGTLEMDAGTNTGNVMQVSGGAAFNLGAGAALSSSAMFVGAGTGGGALNLGAGAALTCDTFGAGQGTATDVITLGAGTTFSTTSSFLAENLGTTGTYNINGGVWTNTQDMYQSDSNKASTVALNITAGGSVSTGTIHTSSGGTWTTALSNGSFTFTGTGTAANAWGIASGGGTISNANDVTLSGAVNGTGALTKTGAGTLSLTADNGYTGALTISAGTVQVGDGSATVNTKFSSVVDNGALTFSAGANNSYGGNISGSGGWTVRGNGGSSGHSFTGAATHTGGTVVDGDTLTLGGGGTTGSVSGSVAFINGGSLVFSRSDSFAFTNAIINAGGTLGMAGTGVVSFGSAAIFDVAQAYVGTLNFTGAFTATTQMLAENGGTLAVTGGSAQVSTGALYVGFTGSGFVSVSGGGSLTTGNITFGLGGGSGSLNVSGAGTSLTSTGQVSGVSGTLSITSQASVTVNQLNDVAVTLDNATLNLNSVTSSSAPIAITIGGGTIAVLNDSATLTGSIIGSGMLSKTGRGVLIVNGPHLHSGDTSVNQGTLRMSSASLATTSRVGVATGATLELNFAGTNTVKAFYIDGVLQALGTWGGTASTATNKTSLIAGTGLLNVTTGTVTFSKWAASMGLDGSAGKASGFDDDPDNDGMVNGLEYVLGGNPLSGDGGSTQPTSAVGSGYLTLSFHRSTASIGSVTLSVDYSTTLTSWTSVPIGTASSTADGGVIVTITPDASGNDLISVAMPQLHGRLFARVTVTQ